MSRAPISPIPNGGFLRPIARPLNEAIRQVNEFGATEGKNGLRVDRGPQGTTFENLADDLRNDGVYAVLVNAGPNGESDYTDSRYWLQTIAIAQAAQAGPYDAASAYLDDSPSSGQWIAAFNVGEISGGTHGLPVVAPLTDNTAAIPAGATVVQVRTLPAGKSTSDPTDDANFINIFEVVGSSTRPSVIVKVTGSAAGGGKYTGRVLTPPTADVSASGNLAVSDFGVVPGADDAFVLNLNEVGQATHILMDASNTFEFYFVGEVVHVNADGTKVVAINGFFGGSC